VKLKKSYQQLLVVEIVPRIFNFTVINWIDTLTSDRRLSLEKPDMFFYQICLYIGICAKLNNMSNYLTYDLLEDRPIDDVIDLFCYIKQVDFMLPSRLFPINSTKWGKNISDTLGHRLVCHFFVLIICDLLLNRQTHGNMESTCQIIAKNEKYLMWFLVYVCNLHNDRWKI